MPVPRGLPVTSKPHTRNASAFPCTSATRLCCPRVIPLYPGEKRYSNSCSDHARGNRLQTPYRGTVANPNPSTPYRGRSALRCLSLFSFSRCTPPGGKPPTELDAIRGVLPRALYGGHCPANLSGGGAPVPLTVPIIHGCTPPVNTFFKKLF